ncbi:glycosyl hydrolase family 28-related protein [Paraburkholderia caribensis]|uniref:glycosyl hydrolase family 28-related protein n=1 Tax=Paraburkholderia caribensis TaxID=75105 RepID=UPI001CABFEEC|nr:glycosyl hydrolase family 28-related protein [Paraburkholderia caribensis]CAG9256017.1 Pectate_lyase_3 domain-containing protein [Paraburkholderia caribensis]
MASLLPNGKQQFVDQNGRPLVGGQVFYYEPGTETKKDTYIDSSGTTPNTNPVLLNARGQAIIWGSGSYRQVVYDKNGVLVWDEVISASIGETDLTPLQTQVDGIMPALAAPTGASLMGFTATETGSIARTVADELNDGFANPKRFGAKGDDSHDDSVAIQAAIDELSARGGGVLRFPLGNYRCNVVLKPGVSLISGCGMFGYLPGSISAVTLSQAAPGFVVDTPATLVQGGAIEGFNFAGLGAAYAGGAVRLQNAKWTNVRKCSANNFADQGFQHVAGFGVIFEDLLTTNVLLNRGRTGVSGCIEMLGTDDFMNRIEANPSLGGIVSANLFVAGIVIGGANNFVNNIVGEFAERGIYIAPQAGAGHRLNNCRADSNVGHGYYVDGSALWGTCYAYHNSTGAAATYSGFYMSASSGGNSFHGCRSEGITGLQQSYGFEDHVNNGVVDLRNSYWGCGGANNANGLYLTQGFLGSGVVAPPQFIRPADGTTVIDITGTSAVNFAAYSTATNVTNFTGGAEGQTIRVLGDAQVTIVNGSGILTPTGANVALADKTMYSFTQYNGNWYLG